MRRRVSERAGWVLTLLVHLDRCLDLLELVEDERIGLVAIRMVVREGAQRLGLLALAHEPTRGLGHEPDEEDLDYGGQRLKRRWDAPGPGAVDLECAIGGPSSAVRR